MSQIMNNTYFLYTYKKLQLTKWGRAGDSNTCSGEVGRLKLKEATNIFYDL